MTTLCELLGLAAVVLGTWLIYIPAGIIVLGLALILVSVLAARS